MSKCSECKEMRFPLSGHSYVMKCNEHAIGCRKMPKEGDGEAAWREFFEVIDEALGIGDS